MHKTLLTTDLEKTAISSRRQKRVSLTFGPVALSKTFWNVDLEKGSNVIQQERCKDHLLLIGGIAKNIVNAWI